MGQSWGMQLGQKPEKVVALDFGSSHLMAQGLSEPLLAFGLGRSYGDSCLTRGSLLLGRERNHFLAFDPGSGQLTCEGGVSLGELLQLSVPAGWFLPVTPGTQFVTLGGAIANDVHGKNHHVRGSFGCHVLEFALLRSDGDILVCSPENHREFWHATIGGLGLTGLILWARIQLIPISSAMVSVESVKFAHIDEYFDLAKRLDTQYEYSVAWLDCTSGGESLGRGIYMGGRHSPHADGSLAWNHVKKMRPRLGIPFTAPHGLLNQVTVQAFNTAYYHKQIRKTRHYESYFASYFYPLDSVNNWNRVYGKRGLLQYQFVIPAERGTQAFKDILTMVTKARKASFLAVLKTFGEMPSPGLLSFPRPGFTLALDFPFEGDATLALLKRLDAMVLEQQGVVYPAKDARMSASSFQQFYPQWQQFLAYKDPAFSSCFWERVTNER